MSNEFLFGVAGGVVIGIVLVWTIRTMFKGQITGGAALSNADAEGQNGLFNVKFTTTANTRKFNMPPAALALIKQHKRDDAVNLICRETGIPRSDAEKIADSLKELNKTGGVSATTQFTRTLPHKTSLKISVGGGDNHELSQRAVALVESGDDEEACRAISSETGMDQASARSLVQNLRAARKG